MVGFALNGSPFTCYLWDVYNTSNIMKSDFSSTYIDLFLMLFVHKSTLSVPLKACCNWSSVLLYSSFAPCFFTNLEFFHIWGKINSPLTNIRRDFFKKKNKNRLLFLPLSPTRQCWDVCTHLREIFQKCSTLPIVCFHWSSE